MAKRKPPEMPKWFFLNLMDAGFVKKEIRVILAKQQEFTGKSILGKR